MFTKARLKLTLGYTLFFAVVIAFFSVALYASQLRALDTAQSLSPGVFERFEERLAQVPPQRREDIRQELVSRINTTTDSLRSQLKSSILFVDAVMLAICIVISFLLAGVTLGPIESSYYQQRRFLEDASHELRTPLAVMQSELDLASRVKTTHKVGSIFTSLTEEVSHLTELVNQITQLARLEGLRPKESLSMKKVDLSLLTKKSVKRFQSQAAKKKVKLLYKSSTKGKFMVKGTRRQLAQVLAILIDNALKYTPQNGNITCRVDNYGWKVRLIVTDTGPGLSKKEQQFIFERLYRTDTARSSEGSGLGLSIARALVKRHRGSIKVQSNKGKGSSFTVLLPRG